MTFDIVDLNNRWTGHWHECSIFRTNKTLDIGRVDVALSAIELLPFAVPADSENVKLRVLLAANGKPIEPNDSLIAAHALSLGLTLVTGNVRELKRVSCLSVVNWRR